MFDYPLTFDELYSHLGQNCSPDDFNRILSEMLSESLLQSYGNYFLSPFASTQNVVKREMGNKMALKMMPVAIKWGRRLFRFPYVRSISLSGSLSKNYFDQNSDIDFFIVTEANRLWICRTLLILYWKLSPAENKKKFCTNYFVDETVLEWEEQNRFTATELSYLVPLVNGEAKHKILLRNPWVNNYISNKPLNRNYETEAPSSYVKKIAENILNNPLGNLLENYLLKKTLNSWRKKYPELASEDFELQFRSRKNICKRHTKGFQNKVLKLHDEKVAEFETRLFVKLT